MSTPSLSRPDLLAVAVAAEVDPRTVAAYLARARQHRTTRAAVERALKERGHEALIRSAQASAAA